MRKLGEILLEKGVTSVGELHTALESCHRFRSRLGTQLLRLGFVTEKQLLEALAEQTGRPPVPKEVLDTASIDVLGLLPLKIARRLNAVPFGKFQKTLQVAMSNPRDEAVVEEIRSATGLDVEPFVVTEATLNAALERLGIEKESAPGPVVREAGAGLPDSSWENLWDGVPPSPEVFLSLPDTFEVEGDDGISYVTYPGLAPVGDPFNVATPGFLDAEGLGRALSAADTRDSVGSALLAYAARYLTRLCLFSIYKDQVHGWLIEGMGPVLEDVQAFVIDLKTPSILQTVALSGRPHEGPLPESEINRSIAACLGDPVTNDVVLVPIRLKDRTVAFLMGDIPGQSTIGIPVGDLVSAADVTGIALEMILLRRKISKVLGA